MDNTDELARIFAPVEELTYAASWKRFAALLLDIFVLYVLTTIVSGGVVFSIFWFRPEYHPDLSDIPRLMTLDAIVRLITCWLYSAVLESSRSQATYGKRAVELQVTDTYGNRISFLWAGVRSFTKYLFLFIFATAELISFSAAEPEFGFSAPFWLVPSLLYLAVGVLAADFLPAVLTEKRRALHDLVTGTVVVERSFFRSLSSTPT